MGGGRRHVEQLDVERTPEEGDSPVRGRTGISVNYGKIHRRDYPMKGDAGKGDLNNEGRDRVPSEGPPAEGATQRRAHQGEGRLERR